MKARRPDPELRLAIQACDADFGSKKTPVTDPVFTVILLETVLEG